MKIYTWTKLWMLNPNLWPEDYLYDFSLFLLIKGPPKYEFSENFMLEKHLKMSRVKR